MRPGRGALTLLAAVVLSAPTLAAMTAEHFADLQKQVEAIRGLAFKRPVPFAVLTRQQILANLTGEIEKETNFPEYGAYLKSFGFVPEDFPLRQTMLALYGEQVGGYYDPRTARFYINGDAVPTTTSAPGGMNMEDVTIAHELTHALQDQYYDLQRLEASVDHGTEDQKLAASALWEGDATAVMIEQPLKQMGLDISALGGMGNLGSMVDDTMVAPQGQFPTFERAPLYFKRSMTFPYLKGLEMVSALRQQGGWDAVNALYTHLPSSTQQVLDGGQPVTAPPAPTFATMSDWQTVTSGTLGAYLFTVWVEQFDSDHPKAGDIHGWRADHYEVDADASHHRMLRWVLEWDGESAAASAWQELSNGMLARHPGLRWAPDGVNRERWSDATGHVTLLQRQAAEVEVLDGVPAAEVETALRLDRVR